MSDPNEYPAPNENYVIEKQDANVDMEEMPEGKMRFGGARNSVQVSQELWGFTAIVGIISWRRCFG